MNKGQADLFAQDNAERKSLSEAERATIRWRLESTLARLQATSTFPWRDPLDAVHEENCFERYAGMLGREGALLWARFDEEMDRLHSTQSSLDDCVTEPTN